MVVCFENTKGQGCRELFGRFVRGLINWDAGSTLVLLGIRKSGDSMKRFPFGSQNYSVVGKWGEYKSKVVYEVLSSQLRLLTSQSKTGEAGSSRDHVGIAF